MDTKKLNVLDHGYVELIDVMGDDRAIAQAAWISTDHERPGEDRSDAAVRNVIRYMMRHHHTTPFEMGELKFRIQMPMDAWRQGVRHRTASINEYSTRYSEAIDLMQKTGTLEWRGQGTSNHQGSEGLLPQSIGETLSQIEEDFQARARQVYKQRLGAGVAKEQARKDLPLSTYTNFYWKIDLHNLLHFLKLRMHPHAQQEIRAYADKIAVFVENLFPYTWEAFVDYRLEAVTFSRMEVNALRRLLYKDVEEDALVDYLKEQRCGEKEIDAFLSHWK